MLIEGFGSIRRQSRSQSPLSLDQRSGESETLVKSRKRQIRWAVEKQFKFPGTVFCFYLPTLLSVYCGGKIRHIFSEDSHSYGMPAIHSGFSIWVDA